MKKAGLMSTISSTLGTVETLMVEATKALDTVASYNTNWKEEREIALAELRHERALRWAKLGKAIRTEELDISDVHLARGVYLEGE